VINHLTPNGHFSGRTAPQIYRCCIFFYLFNKYTYWIFLNCCLVSVFSSSKWRLFHNATFFGACIIHILNTGGVLKFKKKKFRRLKVKKDGLNFVSPYFKIRTSNKYDVHYTCLYAPQHTPDSWLRYSKFSARSTGWLAWATLKTLLNSSHVLLW
jgi:hypothetical protein